MQARYKYVASAREKGRLRAEGLRVSSLFVVEFQGIRVKCENRVHIFAGGSLMNATVLCKEHQIAPPGLCMIYRRHTSIDQTKLSKARIHTVSYVVCIYPTGLCHHTLPRRSPSLAPYEYALKRAFCRRRKTNRLDKCVFAYESKWGLEALSRDREIDGGNRTRRPLGTVKNQGLGLSVFSKSFFFFFQEKLAGQSGFRIFSG